MYCQSKKKRRGNRPPLAVLMAVFAILPAVISSPAHAAFLVSFGGTTSATTIGGVSDGDGILTTSVADTSIHRAFRSDLAFTSPTGSSMEAWGTIDATAALGHLSGAAMGYASTSGLAAVDSCAGKKRLR